MFCVECGREGPTYDSLCEDCFLSRNVFVELDEHIDLVRCAHCTEFLMGSKWVPFGTTESAALEAAINSLRVRADAVIESVGAEVLPLDRNNYQVKMEVVVEVRGLKTVEHLATTVRVKRASCPKCSKIKGSYFESIVQVRSRGRSLDPEERDEVLGEIEDMVERASDENRDLFISRVEELHGGFDVYLSSNSLGRSISKELASMYGAETKESSTLVGQKDGKDVYRITFLVRLPSYRIHDVISLDGRLYFVDGISPTTTRVRDLVTHRQSNLPNVDLERAKVRARESELLEGVVVSETEDELQVLHPITYLTHDLRRPEGFEAQGYTVRIYSQDGEMYLIPP